MEGFKYVCPISAEEIEWGVMLADGFVYEYDTIQEYLKVKNLEFGIEYPQLTHSPYTKEKLQSSVVVDCGYVWRFNNRYLEEIKCCITRNIIKIPYVIFSTKGPIHQVYEYNALVEYINSDCNKRKKEYYYNYNLESSEFYGNDVVIVPDKSLMIELGIPIGKHQMQTINLPQTAIPTSKKIFSLPIRKLLEEKNFSYDSLKQEFVANSIPVITHGYAGSEIVIMNLDLSKLRINRGFKGCVFYNCNLSGTVIVGGMARCQFNYCIMDDVIFVNSFFIGEEVSFYGSVLDNMKLFNDFRLEKGRSWIPCEDLNEICDEMAKRGAIPINNPTMFERQ